MSIFFKLLRLFRRAGAAAFEAVEQAAAMRYTEPVCGFSLDPFPTRPRA
jgi:hypothetical protein